MLQWHLLGKLSILGFYLNADVQLDDVNLDVIKTSEIKDETLNNERLFFAVH